MATTFRPPTESRLIQWRQWWQLRSPAERSLWMVATAVAAALIAWRYAIAAERRPLESVARPLAFVE